MAKPVHRETSPGHMRALPAPADHLIAYRTVDFEQRARQITGDPAVEFILDAIRGDSRKKGYQLLAPTDRFALCGASLAATSKTGGASGILSMLATHPGCSSISFL